MAVQITALPIRGGASRDPSFRKHSLRVFFRKEYGAGKLNYPLFENEGAQECLKAVSGRD